MTVLQRRLAGLWPWLLMAALQVVFGQTGLELAAAVESERSATRAVIKVTLLKHEPTGRPITLEGVFAGGSAGSAEGKLMQVGVRFVWVIHEAGALISLRRLDGLRFPKSEICCSCPGWQPAAAQGTLTVTEVNRFLLN